jgi:hypothetical protein
MPSLQWDTDFTLDAAFPGAAFAGAAFVAGTEQNAIRSAIGMDIG